MENNYFYRPRHSKLRSKILDDFLSNNLEENTVMPDSPMRNFKFDNSKLKNSPSNYSLGREKYEKESLEDSTSTKYTLQELLDHDLHHEIGDGDNKEKEDTPKSEIIQRRQLDTSKTWENIQSLERIVQLLEQSSDSVRPLPIGNKICGAPALTNTNVPHSNKPRNVFMFVVIFVLSIFKLSFNFLDFLKKYFEKGLVLNWKYMMRNFSTPTEYGESGKVVRSEIHFLTFLVISPLFIIFLVAYTGLLILYFAHKAVLDCLPESLQEKINWGYWLDKLWNGKLDF